MWRREWVNKGWYVCVKEKYLMRYPLQASTWMNDRKFVVFLKNKTKNKIWLHLV